MCLFWAKILAKKSHQQQKLKLPLLSASPVAARPPLHAFTFWLGTVPVTFTGVAATSGLQPTIKASYMGLKLNNPNARGKSDQPSKLWYWMWVNNFPRWGHVGCLYNGVQTWSHMRLHGGQNWAALSHPTLLKTRSQLMRNCFRYVAAAMTLGEKWQRGWGSWYVVKTQVQSTSTGEKFLYISQRDHFHFHSSRRTFLEIIRSWFSWTLYSD